MTNKTIAVLLTCHNRCKKTLSCLESFNNVVLPEEYSCVVYLVDDGSTDGTSAAVKLNFPQVNIIQGSGELFWSKGMHLAWETAAKQQAADFYLWLNDDTLLSKHAIVELLGCYFSTYEKDKHSNIIVGACSMSPNDSTFSYGGKSEKGPVIPNGKIQDCKFINGNVVLIPKDIFQMIGNISLDYTHLFGDYDYGLRAQRAGFKCYTTREYIAACPTNMISAWCDPKKKLKIRWQLFHSPKGLNISEYIMYLKRNQISGWFTLTVKAYLKLLFPFFYNKIAAYASSNMSFYL